MIDIIKTAIINRRSLSVQYAPGTRLIEPHCLGRSGDGFYLLRAFQTGGASASGEHVHWKLFRLDRMSSVVESGDSFLGPRPLYNPNDKAMKMGIIARL